MGKEEVKILYYVDDIVLIAETEDDLQQMLNRFNKRTRKYVMQILISKTARYWKTKFNQP